MRSIMNALSLLLLPILTAGCAKPNTNFQAGSGYSGSVQDKMTQYGCPTCHVIPGVPGAVGKVGPSLDSLAQRSYLAGRLSNNRANLQFWLMHPQSIEPGAAMPEMGVTQGDARQMAEFLEPVR
jgi:cytochrome c